MRKYFITGGTGFIGREIVRQLLVKPDTESVTCLTRGKRDTATLPHHPLLRYWLGDVTECAFPAEDFTDLIHGANDANDLMQPDQLSYYYTIVEGTNRILKWATTRKIERRLILSSGAVARDTIYGRAKRQCELIAQYYGGCRIARIFSVIGEEMPLNGQFAAGKFIRMALTEGRVRVWGGTSQRTYLHVEDCARWLLEILDYGGFSTKPHDVAGTVPITILALAEMVAEVFGVPLERIDGPDREDNYLPDSDSRDGLMSIYTALERIREHYIRHPYVEPR
jgi:nucleoside-diphosphate-sugar epimerase